MGRTPGSIRAACAVRAADAEAALRTAADALACACRSALSC